MSVTVSAKSTNFNTVSYSSGTGVTATHTLMTTLSGDTGILVECVWVDTGLTTVSATWGGTAMSLVGSIVTDATNFVSVALFWLRNPTVGNQTFQVTFTTSNGGAVTMYARSYQGNDVATATSGFKNFASATGTTTTASVTVTSASGDFTYGAFGANGGAGGDLNVNGNNNTKLYVNSAPATGCNSAAEELTGAASVTHSWTLTAGAGWVATGVDIVAATAATPVAGWECQNLSLLHPRPEIRAAAIMRGDDGTQDIRRNWVNDGWEIQPPQPPHPIPEKRAAGIMRGDDGIQDIRRGWQNAGWEVQPHQPQHPKPEQRAAAVMRGDDGTQDIKRNWVNDGWEIQPHNPPHPKRERTAGIMRGDDGTQAVFVPPSVVTWGFDQIPMMLKRPRYLSSRMRGPDGIEQPFAQWVNAGWEIQSHQPPHPRSERSGAIVRSEDILVPPPTVITWGFEQVPFLSRQMRTAQAAIMRGDDGVQASFAQWVNAGWEIQPPQPPYPKWGRPTATKGKTEFAIFASWVNAGWEVQPFQPPHPKPERFGAVARGDDGTQAVFVPPSVVTFGFDQTVLPIRRPRIVSVAQGDDGLTSFSLWQNAGWEIQPPQPPHPRPERSGAIVRSEDILVTPPTITWGFDQTPIQLRSMRWVQAASLMRGDDGTQVSFIQWVNDGWEVQSVQPPHPRRERFGAIALGDGGTQAQFVPPFVATLGFEFVFPNLAKKRISTLQGGDDGLTTFLNWVNAGWEVQSIQPPHPRVERFGSVVRGDDGLTLLQQWLNAGWEIQSVQPPHLRPERFGTIVRGDDGIQAIFVPPPTIFLGFEAALPLLAIRLSRYPAIEGRSEFLASGILPWVEDQAWQPFLRLYRRAGATHRGHDGTDAVFVPPVITPWGYEAPFTALRIPRRDASLHGDDGTQAQFLQWLNAGWEIQSVQPPHPRPERFGATVRGDDGTQALFVPPTVVSWGYDGPPVILRIPRRDASLRGDDGTQATFISLRNLEWPSPYVFPRTRPERSGAIQRGHDGIERPPPVFTTGWEVQPFQPPHFGRERAAAFMRGDDGLTTFLQWRNAGWEIQPFQPSHFGRERTAGIMRGDDGTQAAFLQWRNAGWEIQPVQPPHFGRERQAAGIMRGDDGTQSQFNFFRLLEWPAPPMYRRPPTNLMGALARGDDGLTKFIQALNILFAGVGGLTASAALIKHICVFPGRGVVGNPTEPPGSGGNTTVSGRGVVSNPSVGGPGAKVC